MKKEQKTKRNSSMGRRPKRSSLFVQTFELDCERILLRLSTESFIGPLWTRMKKCSIWAGSLETPTPAASSSCRIPFATVSRPRRRLLPLLPVVGFVAVSIPPPPPRSRPPACPYNFRHRVNLTTTRTGPLIMANCCLLLLGSSN
jgi:hypothetical protein